MVRVPTLFLPKWRLKPSRPVQIPMRQRSTVIRAVAHWCLTSAGRFDSLGLSTAARGGSSGHSNKTPISSSAMERCSSAAGRIRGSCPGLPGGACGRPSCTTVDRPRACRGVSSRCVHRKSLVHVGVGFPHPDRRATPTRFSVNKKSDAWKTQVPRPQSGKFVRLGQGRVKFTI